MFFLSASSNQTQGVAERNKNKEMTFEIFFATLIALMFGVALIFWGYRIFLVLLPIWGFIFGFIFGAETMQIVFGTEFLATTISWVVGFFVGALFAILSYVFYAFAVGLIAGSLGYGIGIGLMSIFNLDLTFLTWLVGIVFAVGAIIVTFAYNIQKYVIIVATAFIGTAISIGTLLLGVQGLSLSRFIQNPVQLMLADSPFWTLMFLALAIWGIVMQVKTTKGYELEQFEDRI